MGPLKGESDMEPYGRCWELLKYFSFVQGPMWESRFGTVVKIRNAPLVSESNLPQWMKPDSEESAKDPVKPSANPEDFSHPIHVKLNWDNAFPCPELQEHKNALAKARSRKIWIPPHSRIMPYDPRVCTSGDMFRDLLRALLNCQELNVNLRDVVITYTPVGNARELEYSKGQKTGKVDNQLKNYFW